MKTSSVTFGSPPGVQLIPSRQFWVRPPKLKVLVAARLVHGRAAQAAASMTRRLAVRIGESLLMGRVGRVGFPSGRICLLLLDLRGDRVASNPAGVALGL